MDALFNFQYGDSYNEGPGWFDWFSLCLNCILVILGFIVAYAVYFKQRKDNARDAHVLFGDSIDILKEAIAETIKKLEKLSVQLENPNDDFSNPSLSASLNDKLISKVDLSSLKRYYESNEKENLPKLRAFLKASGFFGDYHNYFVSELNNIREGFLSKEEKFMQYQLLLNNIFFEILAERDGANYDFVQEYAALHAQIFANREVIDADFNMLNRNLFNESFIIPVARIAGRYINIDPLANKINQIANEVNAARVDMNAIKAALKKLIDKDIEKFKELNPLLKALSLKS